jgi:hypothetical protein
VFRGKGRELVGSKGIEDLGLFLKTLIPELGTWKKFDEIKLVVKRRAWAIR